MSLPLILEWFETALRSLHVIAAIFWVGAALIFLRLNLSIKSSKADVFRAADDGFFQIARTVNPAAESTPQIGWFRWEAYVTWLSGAALMVTHYFVNADLALIDPDVLPVARWVAVTIAIAALVIGWLVYDFICKAPFGWSETVRRTLVFVLFVATAFALAHVFSGRGAFLVLGAILGTIMAANVAHVLVPNQRRMLEAVRKGEAPEEARFAASRQRALHNNYLALGVVFLMLSNHYPLLFSARANWLVAALLIVIGAAVRHFYIARHRGQGDLWWTWALAAASAALIVWLAAPAPAPVARASAPDDAQAAIASVVAPRFSDVVEIVEQRCAVCHAQAPSREGIVVAPKGVRLDTPARIRRHAGDIAKQSVWTHAMPPRGSEVELAASDRAIIAAWLKAGAPE